MQRWSGFGASETGSADKPSTLPETHLVQPPQQRYRRRQQGTHAIRPLPRERLPFQALRLAFPGAADVEVQAHVRVLVHVLDAAPGFRAEHPHAQLLHELALQRMEDILARLDFPAREFPVAGIGLALGALAQQHVAVRAHQHADGDVDRFLRRLRHPRSPLAATCQRSRGRTARPRGPSASRAPAPSATRRRARPLPAPACSRSWPASGRRCPGSRPA